MQHGGENFEEKLSVIYSCFSIFL